MLHTIIDAYFQAWVHKDEGALLKTLDQDIYCKESTGDVYEGIEVVGAWFRGWHQGDNQVLSWQIGECWQVEDQYFLKWVFKCRFEGILYTFDGMSQIRIHEDRIIEINEYSQVHDNKYPYGR